MVKIAINGFGRIGRGFFKLVLRQAQDKLEIVAINDLGGLNDLAYLLQHDSVYGNYRGDVKTKIENLKNYLIVDEKDYLFLNEKDATKLPWANLGVDIVVESSGAFESYEKAAVHKKAGAKRVVITAPAEDEDGPDGRTVLMGINEEDLKTCTISSNGSCTTNSAASIMQIFSDKLGIKKAFLNTAHAYTASQASVKNPSIIPSATGAEIAITRVIPELKDKFDGMAMRVPVQDGSISAITFVSARPTTTEEINSILKTAEAEPRWQGIFKTISGSVVSSDIVGDPYPAIADLSLTKVVDGDLCCVYSWYDNEFGYANSLVVHVLKVAGNL
ncbi:MAG: glyceraldehyde 3-phosphate dehydrogenase NAD-binding domain-containing protein [Patescibacteria group bacterium]